MDSSRRKKIRKSKIQKVNNATRNNISFLHNLIESFFFLKHLFDN